MFFFNKLNITCCQLVIQVGMDYINRNYRHKGSEGLACSLRVIWRSNICVVEPIILKTFSFNFKNQFKYNTDLSKVSSSSSDVFF